VLKNDCCQGRSFSTACIKGIIISVTYVPSLCDLICSELNAGFAQIFALGKNKIIR
jgi:hypothetical protein